MNAGSENSTPQIPEPASPLAQTVHIGDYRPRLRIGEYGTVASVGDGIAWVTGLPSAAMDDVLMFEDGSWAVVFALTKKRIGAVLLHQSENLTAGTPARLAGRTLDVPVGETLLGRVIDPIGNPLDGGRPLETRNRRPLDSPSPPIIARDFVQQPLYTGTRLIDTLVPIGKGQRQLIIGDEGTGRSSLAIDAVLNQKGREVRCVYVLIGQKRSTVVGTIELLRNYGALAYTTVVVGEAGSLPGLKYLAPFAGCAIAEDWMARGHDTLVVYDDLSTHAQTYRELSLLLRRPPGREAYPGDIFYLHARLLERATALNPANGGGSMTALPIVETRLGEIEAYIPTNLISITDGQIYLDSDLFAAGFKPAIDVTRSVSRIGGKAQHPRIKEEAGRMKLDYLQFLELEIFTRFGARLESGMEARIRRGRLLREILRQERLQPLPPEFQLAWMTAYNEGLLDAMPPGSVQHALNELNSALRNGSPPLEASRTDWLTWLRQNLPEPARGEA
ncbi:F0F1 ATP synthase subunit alpha [Methylococcus capsulatus]|uniref:F0F1 ATP synthase subunit alpha n=1 Tax=Methylococcus capsulatus TaxID=414 RepID=UPI001C531C2D|nr:F0F1 ATP synthase subunit alpha [Methylococcus capsulatus]QXP86804.1 F0F1 ATP synthase subunit alpha [Methylococcus capsulatus]QXP93518.1 F0F1 ATP synthase subunit alpha [Methylococcus capsulatus]UQN11778.1 F0F1 ATP synthase subunit alpha [Methylococcus capsulatus]